MAEFAQRLHGPSRLVSEMEVIPLMHFQGMQLVPKNVSCKLPWCKQRQIASEGKQQNRVEARLRQQPQLFGRRSEQLESRVGPQNPHWMRFERHCDRAR